MKLSQRKKFAIILSGIAIISLSFLSISNLSTAGLKSDALDPCAEKKGRLADY